jgi:hypothetical protein
MCCRSRIAKARRWTKIDDDLVFARRIEVGQDNTFGR